MGDHDNETPREGYAAWRAQLPADPLEALRAVVDDARTGGDGTLPGIVAADPADIGVRYDVSPVACARCLGSTYVRTRYGLDCVACGEQRLGGVPLDMTLEHLPRAALTGGESPL